MEMLLFEAIAQTQLIVANPQETLTRVNYAHMPETND
jgi:hypothetical protein